jgi:hypothetical protein
MSSREHTDERESAQMDARLTDVTRQVINAFYTLYNTHDVATIIALPDTQPNTECQKASVSICVHPCPSFSHPTVVAHYV